MQKNMLIGGFLITLLIGATLGYFGAQYQYSGVLERAKVAFPILPTMSVISGTVTGIADNVITIQTATSINPFETLPSLRKVTVTGDTKLVKNAPKDPKVFQQEMDAFQKAMQQLTPTGRVSTSSAVTRIPTPPMPVNEIAIKISDIKIGDMLIIDAGKDVKLATSFAAIKVTATGSSVTGSIPPLSVPVPPAMGAAAPISKTPPPAPAGQVAPIVNLPTPVPAKK